MEQCIAVASQKQKEVIWLGVWKQNHSAISFYHKWGFEKFSTHQFILGDDVQTDWLMKKTLAADSFVQSINTRYTSSLLKTTHLPPLTV